MAHPLDTRWDPAEDEVADPRPYDYGGSKRAFARGSREQAEAARFQREAGEKLAQAERDYRVALAKKVHHLHAVEGVAWTACADLARGDEEVAALKFARDLARATYEACEQVAWQASSNRRALERLVDWSARIAPDGQYERGVV